MRAQIQWGEEFEHEAAREVFGANLLVLTWIKGEPMPDGLVDEILRGLGLERETEGQRQTRMSPAASSGAARRIESLRVRALRIRDEESESEDEDVEGVPESKDGEA